MYFFWQLFKIWYSEWYFEIILPRTDQYTYTTMCMYIRHTTYTIYNIQHPCFVSQVIFLYRHTGIPGTYFQYAKGSNFFSTQSNHWLKLQFVLVFFPPNGCCHSGTCCAYKSRHHSAPNNRGKCSLTQNHHFTERDTWWHIQHHTINMLRKPYLQVPEQQGYVGDLESGNRNTTSSKEYLWYWGKKITHEHTSF